MPATWSIYYDRWIIDDGEPEREAGEHFQWSLVSFGSLGRLTQAATPARSAIEVDDHDYEDVAEVLYLSSTAVVIDFGLMSFGPSNLVPSGCRPGDYIAGRIKIFFTHYCDSFLPDRFLESMNHSWLIKGLMADLTPYRPGDVTGRWFIRDSQNATYEPVKSTREKKAQSYVLQCCLLPSGIPTESEGSSRKE